ncbi:MAG TPA: hypothetical protein VE994_09425 [Terriglobales bacterium]|nr:hypothetical protein [Terriglobales bacterium]
MQLHFTVPQLQLLAEILSEQKGAIAEDLLDRVLAKDLRFDFDELDQLSVLLNSGRRELLTDLAEAKSAATVAALERKQQLLDQIIERVSEAFAMV